MLYSKAMHAFKVHKCSFYVTKKRDKTNWSNREKSIKRAISSGVVHRYFASLIFAAALTTGAQLERNEQMEQHLSFSALSEGSQFQSPWLLWPRSPHCPNNSFHTF
jgi:hypothetical protein